MTTNNNYDLSILDNDTLDLSKVQELIGINIEKINLGMTPFQITNFVLNKKEFPTPFAQFLQSRSELYLRANTIIDLYFQYRECIAKITLAEGRKEKIEQEEAVSKIKEAKLELQSIEIDKNKLRMQNIKNQIVDKLKETKVFYEVYKKNKHFETDSIEDIQKAEEEYWRIKSAYYPELPARYMLTPQGFMELPHEKEGLKGLTGLINSTIIPKQTNKK